MSAAFAAAGVLALGALGWFGSGCRVAAAGHGPSPQPSASVVLAAASAIPVTLPVVERPPLVGGDVAAPPSSARHEPCGSFSRLLTAGSGELRANDDDRVLLEYSTFNRSGQLLDDSTTHDDPVSESVRNLAPGLGCVIKRMQVGEARRVWIPAALQTKDEEEPRAEPAVDLTIDVTLKKLTRAPQRPVDYAWPPRSARCTASGLCFQILRRGTDQRRPVANSRVTIYHSGWTNRGVLFESSVLAGRPASYLSYELPIGLSEGVQMMNVGDKRRFWLPERLAYAGANRGAPKGPVVFDVELLAVD